MNCEEATKLMDGYLDGELDPITSQTIEQHLRDCRKCEQAYEAHGSLIRAISQCSSLLQGAGRIACSEFTRRCERRSPNGPREMLREMLSRCSQEGSQSRGPFFLGHRGIGWLSLRRSFSLRSSL